LHHAAHASVSIVHFARNFRARFGCSRGWISPERKQADT
jgi:hypothetical protein